VSSFFTTDAPLSILKNWVDWFPSRLLNYSNKQFSRSLAILGCRHFGLCHRYHINRNSWIGSCPFFCFIPGLEERTKRDKQRGVVMATMSGSVAHHYPELPESVIGLRTVPYYGYGRTTYGVYGPTEKPRRYGTAIRYRNTAVFTDKLS
jgi:hypothetical protein